jgi:hypothetical protein
MYLLAPCGYAFVFEYGGEYASMYVCAYVDKYMCTHVFTCLHTPQTFKQKTLTHLSLRMDSRYANPQGLALCKSCLHEWSESQSR